MAKAKFIYDIQRTLNYVKVTELSLPQIDWI